LLVFIGYPLSLSIKSISWCFPCLIFELFLFSWFFLLSRSSLPCRWSLLWE